MTKPEDCAYPATPEFHQYGGLTKREYFAAMALQGLLANMAKEPRELSQITSHPAGWAVEFADALIEALNEEVK